MMLIALLVGVPIVLFVGLALWFLVPTLRTVGKPDFEPTPKDEASVYKAENSSTITGGGAGAGM
jgi:hypothetical protein